MDLDFNSRSQKCEKAKVSVAIFSQSFQLFKMECGILSRRVSMVNLIFSLFHPFSIQGKEPCLCDYEKKNWHWLVFRFTDWFLSNMYDDGEHWALNFDISLDDLDLHCRSQFYEKSKTLVSIFLQIYRLIWINFSLLLQPLGLLKLMQNLFCFSNIQRRELCWLDFTKYMF